MAVVRLGPDHRQKVQQALLDAYTTKASLAELTLTGLDKNLEEIPGDGLRASVVNLVTWAQEEGQLVLLLEKARDGRSGNKPLAAVMDNALAFLASQAPWYEPPDPYDACFVRRMAFLDRREFREHLRELGGEGGARTLAVGGEARSGRSHSFHLISFVNQSLGNDQVLFVDLPKGPNFRPDQLIRYLAIQLDNSADLSTLPTREFEQGTRWNDGLAAWFVGATRGRGPLWVVIDGVDQVALREDTRDLIEELVRAAHFTAPWLRVVLLAYSEPLPPNLERTACRDTIGRIDSDMVEDFFALFASHQGVDPDPGAITAIVDKVMRTVPEEDPDYLMRLADSVAAAAQKLVNDYEGNADVG